MFLVLVTHSIITPAITEIVLLQISRQELRSINSTSLDSRTTAFPWLSTVYCSGWWSFTLLRLVSGRGLTENLLCLHIDNKQQMWWTDSSISLCVYGKLGMFGMCWGSCACTVLPETSCLRLPAYTQVNRMCEAVPGCLLLNLHLELCKLLSIWKDFPVSGLAPFPPLSPSLQAFLERKIWWFLWDKKTLSD